MTGRTGSTAALAALALALAAAGCGGSDAKKDDEGNAIVLTQGQPPSAADCGFDRLGNSANTTEKGETPPAPGIYSYTTEGTDSVPGSGGKPRPLPKTSDQLVTPSRTSGGLTCFATEQRFSPTTRVTNVYLIRGGDIYIVAIGFASSNYVRKVRPQPAILAVSGSSDQYAGKFSGDTSGKYGVEVVQTGKRKVGGKSVDAAKLSVKASFTGQLEGTQQRTTWLATDRALTLEEAGRTDLHFGGDVEKLSYTITLSSLEPR